MAAESKTQNMMEAKKGLFFEKYYYGLLLAFGHLHETKFVH